MGVIKTSKRMQIAKQKGNRTPIGRVAIILHGAGCSAQTNFNPIRRMVHCENDEHGIPRWVMSLSTPNVKNPAISAKQ